MSQSNEPTAANAHVSVRYGTIDREYAMRLATTPEADDGPVWMVNLMKYREVADYGDGAESGVSGREADDIYAPLGPLAAVGAKVVFVADVDTQLFGEPPVWDRIGVVKYPSGRAFIEMQSRPDFVEKHVHKDAGMEQTIVIGCHPIDFPQSPFEAPDWADVAHPPTAADGPVVVMHVIRFVDGDPGEHMTSYQDVAGAVAVPHGVRIAAWFAAQGTILGDGRQWDQVRFNAFPSKAAFMAVALDPTRLAAQVEHRQTAIADTYALILRPTLDRLQESIAP